MSAHDHNSSDEGSENLVFGKKKHQDTEGTWLISYSDLMTLLMGFFALMMSMATFDDNKSAAVREAATEYFGGEFHRPLEKLAGQLQEMIKKENLSELVVLKNDANGITITFRGTLVFDSGSVELKPEAQAMFDKLIPMINEAAQGYYLLIEGHTDNVPITHPFIPSNWELSGMRASALAREFETFGFDRSHIMVVGWGDTKPLLPNTDKDKGGQAIPENQSANRRVVLKVLKAPIM
jgi:chemotaxis protein MotB